jgi:hypothetical protein
MEYKSTIRGRPALVVHHSTRKRRNVLLFLIVRYRNITERALSSLTNHNKRANETTYDWIGKRSAGWTHHAPAVAIRGLNEQDLGSSSRSERRVPCVLSKASIFFFVDSIFIGRRMVEPSWDGGNSPPPIIRADDSLVVPAVTFINGEPPARRASDHYIIIFVVEKTLVVW